MINLAHTGTSVVTFRFIKKLSCLISRSWCDTAGAEPVTARPSKRRARLTEFKNECTEQLANVLIENQKNKDVMIVLDNIASPSLLSSLQRKSASNIVCLFSDSRQIDQVNGHFGENVHPYQYSWIKSASKNKEMKIMKKSMLSNVTSGGSDIQDSSLMVVSMLQTNQAGRESLLIKRFITSQGFFASAHLDLFCFVSAKFYTKLVRCTYPPPFKTINAFYDHKLCLKLTTKDFIPKVTTSRVGKFSLLPDLSSTDMCLVLLRPRKHVIENFSCKERLMFSLFMKMLTKERLIPKMESLVPGCGLRLVELGFSMAEETSDVHPHRYLTLFKELLTWPEFEGSMLSVMLLDKQGQFKNTSTLYEL